MQLLDPLLPRAQPVEGSGFRVVVLSRGQHCTKQDAPKRIPETQENNTSVHSLELDIGPYSQVPMARRYLLQVTVQIRGKVFR